MNGVGLGIVDCGVGGYSIEPWRSGDVRSGQGPTESVCVCARVSVKRL